MTTDQILDCLDRQRIRATYGAGRCCHRKTATERWGRPWQSHTTSLLGRERSNRRTDRLRSSSEAPGPVSHGPHHQDGRRASVVVRRMPPHPPHDTRSEIQPPPDTRLLGSSLIASPKRPSCSANPMVLSPAAIRLAHGCRMERAFMVVLCPLPGYLPVTTM